MIRMAGGPGRVTPRVRPLDGLRQTFSLAWRTLVQIKHNPLELIDFSVQPVMFLLLFTYVFGGAIGGSPKAYLMFALPGIIVQNSLFTTLNTATGLSTDLKEGFFDRLRSLPIARFAPLSGRMLADLAKQTWAIAMLLGIGYALGSGSAPTRSACSPRPGLVLVSTLAISWALVLVAMLAANPEKVQIFGFVVLFPITFTSDAFVQTASMPGWLQAWSKANPVSLHRGRGARADGVRPGGPAGDRVPALRGGVHRRVRAAGGPGVQAPGVTGISAASVSEVDALAALVCLAVAGLAEHGPCLGGDPFLIWYRTVRGSPDREAGSEQLGGTLRVVLAQGQVGQADHGPGDDRRVGREPRGGQRVGVPVAGRVQVAFGASEVTETGGGHGADLLGHLGRGSQLHRPEQGLARGLGPTVQAGEVAGGVGGIGAEAPASRSARHRAAPGTARPGPPPARPPATAPAP